jgi:hypothetical protein
MWVSYSRICDTEAAPVSDRLPVLQMNFEFKV